MHRGLGLLPSQQAGRRLALLAPCAGAALRGTVQSARRDVRWSIVGAHSVSGPRFAKL